MPRNQNVDLPKNVWTELTNGNAVSVTIQNLMANNYVRLVATTGSAPTSADGEKRLPGGQMFVNETLADLWPGVSGATRVFAMPEGIDGMVSISHA